MSAVAAPWARAYRPLRARSLVAQLAFLAVMEVLLYRVYFGHNADFHWATHFLVGLIAASLANLLWLLVKGAPARGLLLSIYVAHIIAMAPDLLFSFGIPHAQWMNVFLGHIWVHYLPGRNTTWLVLAILASGAYAACLSLWLRARRIEADGGLAPGIGIGGAALVRPQRNPHTTPLAAFHYGPDRPADVVLLHGLAASHQVWLPVARDLAGRGLSVLAPDLLGFGASRPIGTRFLLDDHVDAVRRLLDQHCVRATVVVGHSFGCAVAAALASADRGRVARVVLVSPPVFRDAEEARHRLGRRGRLAREVLRGSPLASFSCNLMCLMRPAAARFIPRLAANLPFALARDGVQHTWPAYRDALETLLRANPLPAWIDHPAKPTTILLGDLDDETPPADVLDHSHQAVRVEVLAADHLLPYTNADEVASRIADVTIEPESL